MPRRRLAAIDALRGLACLWVVFHHAFEGEPALPWPLQVVSQIGWLGVSLFLVLSGFCLYYPLAQTSSFSENRLALGPFFQRRARRILPPYLLSLLVALVLRARFLLQHGQPLTGLFTPWYDLPLHITLLQNLRADTFASLSSVTWSLALEWQLYLVFPLLVALASRKGLRPILLLTLGITLAWQGLAAQRLGVSATWSPERAVLYHALPGRVFEFVCGMLAAQCVAYPRAQHQRVARWVLAICLLPALVLVVHFYRLGPLCDPLWGAVFAAILVLTSQTTLRGKLAHGLVFLGERSYSIYLVHLLVMLAVPIPHAVAAHGLLAGLVRIGVALVVGIAFFQVAERPFLRAKN